MFLIHALDETYRFPLSIQGITHTELRLRYIPDIEIIGKNADTIFLITHLLILFKSGNTDTFTFFQPEEDMTFQLLLLQYHVIFIKLQFPLTVKVKNFWI